MRISDWSSDVCSSDLPWRGSSDHEAVDDLGARAFQVACPADVRLLVEARPQFHQGGHRLSRLRRLDQRLDDGGVVAGAVEGLLDRDDAGVARGLLQEHHYRVEALVRMVNDEIGRASCRERVCQYV